MHNLSTVFSFEVIRTLKKKSFWIFALSFPILMVAIFGIIFVSNKATDDKLQEMKDEKISAVVMDESKMIDDNMLSSFGFSKRSDKTNAIEEARKGEVDAFFYYPTKLENGIEVYAKDVGIFDNSRYDAIARLLVEQSVGSKVDSNTSLVLSKTVGVKTTVYKDGSVNDPFMQMILPGIFLVLFYLMIAMFGGQAVASTTEEKENRVIEMLLTTVKARTVIVGKIIALIVLAIIQAIVLIVPALVIYLLFYDKLGMPAVDFSVIPVDPVRIAAAFVIFAASFMLFIGLLVAIGAAVPTAKDAGGAISAVMMLLFGPLYAFSLFISYPEHPFVQFLTYFPLTAPIPLLLRNAAGVITGMEILIGTTILVTTAFIVVRIAVKVFQHGALEYSRKLSFREIFGK